MLPPIVTWTLARATSPLIAWMRGKGVPQIAALLLTTLLALLVTAGIGVLLVTTAQDLVEKAPEYQTRIEALRLEWARWLHGHGMEAQPRILGHTAIGLGLLMSSMGSALPGITNGIVSIFLTLLVVGFALGESNSLLDKLRGA